MGALVVETTGEVAGSLTVMVCRPGVMKMNTLSKENCANLSNFLF